MTFRWYISVCLSIKFSTILLLLILNQKTMDAASYQRDQSIDGKTQSVITGTGACGVFANINKNDLTPIDIVVKDPDSQIACIRARFSLAIKVEAPIEISREDYDVADLHDPKMGQNKPSKEAINSTGEVDEKNSIQLNEILGYLPLEQVVNVEESCPEGIKIGKKSADLKESPKTTPNIDKKEPVDEKDEIIVNQSDELNKKADTLEEDDDSNDYLEMILTFECGKLAFTFMRNETCSYLSSIRGMVQLDEKVVREFYVARPMLITSDLNHHFKFDELIEINSQAKTKAYMLSANLYFTEIETFRTTTNTDFVQPPDENSKPFPEDHFQKPTNITL